MSMTATAQWAALPDHSAEIARVREEFITAYGYEPDGVWSAPGRLNLWASTLIFGWLVPADAVAVPHLCGGCVAS